MPKYVYDPNEWAEEKYCHGCGYLYFPDNAEDYYCSARCKAQTEEYYDDMYILDFVRWADSL